MKTIEFSDKFHATLVRAALERTNGDVEAYLNSLNDIKTEIQHHKWTDQSKAECALCKDIKTEKIKYAEKHIKYLIAMTLLYRLLPDKFQKLDGITRPDGRVILVSRNLDLIMNTSTTMRFSQIEGSDWWVNTHGGVEDFVERFERFCTLLGASKGFFNQISKIVLKSEPTTEDYI
jgi:hypothetical protein